MDGLLTTKNLYKRIFSILGSGAGVFLALALVAELPSLGSSLLEIVSKTSEASYRNLLDEEPPEDASWETAQELFEAKDRAIDARRKTDLAITAGELLLGLAHLILETLVSAATIYGVFQALRGRPPRLGDCVRVATGRWSHLVALALMVSVTVTVGFFLLVVPGVILICGLFVVVPALVVEDLSPTEALKRSWNLTRGHKGVIFFLGFGITAISGAVVVGSQGLLKATAMAESVAALSLAASVEYLAGGITTALMAIATGVLYHDLRVFREGLDEEELAAVFE